MSRPFDYQTFFKNSSKNKNILFLKKLILVAHLGELQINGQYPNDTYNLSDYLFSDSNFMLDIGQLDPRSMLALERWLKDPHMNSCNTSYAQGVFVEDFRGRTTEKELSWWGRVLNYFFYHNATMKWALESLEMTIAPQLRSIFASFGKSGWLFGFNFLNLEGLLDFQNMVDVERINNQSNSKRIFITPQLVKRLVKTDLDSIDPSELLSQPHPLSITVNPNKIALRQANMAHHRATVLYDKGRPWYVELFNWLSSIASSIYNGFARLFRGEGDADMNKGAVLHPNTTTSEKAHYSESILTDEQQKEFGLDIRYDSEKDRIQVVEKSPVLDTVVFGGGGGKIFAAVGALAATEQHGISFKKFAGSSAGAIVSMLNYLGYNSTETLEFFQDFNQEVLIHWDMDWNGISDSCALKSALDYVINKKILDIINTYKIDQTHTGRKFIREQILPEGYITFRSLKLLKERYPGCSLGENIKITGTNKRTNENEIFSYATTPDMEFSTAVQTSANMPFFFRDTIIDGVPYTDGGATRNFYLEAYREKKTSFLRSRTGLHLGTLGICFENEAENEMMRNFRAPVFRESFIMNFLYSLIIGVKNPASWWERDRDQMVLNSHHVVSIPADVSSSDFNVSQHKRQALYKGGELHTARHLSNIYSCKQNPCQLMYENFDSFEELMVYTASRGNKKLFDQLKNKAVAYGVSKHKIEQLANSHFFDEILPASPRLPLKKMTLQDSLKRQASIMKNSSTALKNMRMYDALYPIFLRIHETMFCHMKEYGVFKKARHKLNYHDINEAVTMLNQLKGERHIVIVVLQHLMAGVSDQSDTLDKLEQYGKALFNLVLDKQSIISAPACFMKWELNNEACDELLDMLIDHDFDGFSKTLNNYQHFQVFKELREEHEAAKSIDKTKACKPVVALGNNL